MSHHWVEMRGCTVHVLYYRGKVILLWRVGTNDKKEKITVQLCLFLALCNLYNVNALYLCFLGVSRTVQCLVRLIFLSPRHSSPRCFFKIFPASSPFRVTRLRFSTLKSCFNADTRSHCWRSNSPLSAERSSSTPAGSKPHPKMTSYSPLLSPESRRFSY